MLRKPVFCGGIDSFDKVSVPDQDFLSLADDEVCKLIDESISDKENTFLGSGSEANVYRIKGTKYCVRVPKDVYAYNRVISRDISAQDLVNHTVLKLPRRISVMPFIEGIHYFSPGMTKLEVGEIVANLHQTAYNKFFKQLVNAKENDMEFDPVYKNFLADTQKQTITGIDFKPTVDYNYNICAKMFRSLIYSFESTFELEKRISGKIVSALLNEIRPSVPCSKIVLRELWNNDSFMNCLRLEGLVGRVGNRDYDKLLSESLNALGLLKSDEMRDLPVKTEFAECLKASKSLVKEIFGII